MPFTAALDNIDLSIKPGETLALVGRSGSGKTTLTSLLLRFYDPDKGQILIDGQEIRGATLSSLRQQIGMVNQQTILFNDTIINNICYGCDPNSIDLQKVKECANHAHATAFIEELPDGFETLIGEDGDRLSGGQRQRIAVARALYKDAPILILDEATSALDTESEKSIQEALDKLQQGRTTIVIAHRLSTIENADKIVALDKGRIIEVGTHSELISKGGYYSALHSAQFGDANG